MTTRKLMAAAALAAAGLTFAASAREPGLIIDNFAGGGGASTGIEAGMGRKVDIAINHDEAAIAVHRANHPGTEHYCQSVWDVSPAFVVKCRTIDLAWFSPDCKHFSKAKGGKPVEKKIRDLAWVVVRWADTLPDDQKPKVIMLENVEEYQDWGPLIETANGWMPCQKRKGDEFRRWIRALKKAGYTRIQWRVMRACDYGGKVHVARTIRKRLFLIARRDGHPIVWPKPTHGDPKSPAVQAGKLKPWHTAAECIDWSIPCPSIFERGRELKPATCRRIAAGIMRYVVNSANPFIVPLTHHGGDRVHDIDAPLPTVTGANRGEMAVIEPFVVPITHTHGGNMAHPAGEPLRTITTAKGGEFALISPHIMTMRNAQKPFQGCDEPTHTVTAEGAHQYLITATLDSQYGKSLGADVEAPMPTITAGGSGKQALIEASLERAERVAAFLAQHNGGNVGRETEEPVSTVTQAGSQQQLVTATLMGCGGRAGQSRPRGLDESTATGTAKADVCIATSHLVKLRGTCADGQPVDEPAPTVTAGGMHVGEVRAFLAKYYSAAEHGQSLNDPMHTTTTKARFGLVTVTIAGEEYVIVDIGMRMLTPRELARAQGFPDTYILDPECHYRTDSGAMKFGRLPKTHQIAKIGNSVCPVMAEVLTAANCWMYHADTAQSEAA